MSEQPPEDLPPVALAEEPSGPLTAEEASALLAKEIGLPGGSMGR